MEGKRGKQRLMANSPQMLALWLCLLAQLCSAGMWDDFFGRHWWDPSHRMAPKFRGGKDLVNITEFVALDQISGELACFADMNSDRFTDLFVLSVDKKQLNVHLWSPEDWKFSSTPASFLTEQYPISNVVASDLNQDGHLDIVVTVSTQISSATVHQPPFELHVYTSSASYNFTLAEVITGVMDHPVLLDWDGDMKIDLLVSNLNATAQQQGDASFTYYAVYQNHGNNSFSKTPHRLSDSRASVVPNSPNSAAFIDLNGDCHSDLFLTVKSPSFGQPDHLEIWTWVKSSNSYVPKLSYDLPTGAGSIAFADFNRDGNLDMLFPVQTAAGASLHMAISQQMTVCGALGGKSCRKSTSMCVADDTFNFDNSAFNNASYWQIISPATFASMKLQFASTDPMGNPPAVHVGDYDLDGYPDFIVAVTNTSTGASSLQLWHNVPCELETCSAVATSKKMRTFKPITTGLSLLSQYSNLIASAFFDFGEDGTPDLIVSTKTGMQAIINNYQPDALFVKTLGLNGVCMSWCPSSPQFPNPRPYGVNYPGGSWKLVMSDFSGNSIAQASGQLYSTGHLSLLTPYAMLGLGRTSNYIDTVTYGVSSKSGANNAWQSVIPNSYLVAIPYKLDNPPYWPLELFVSTGGIVFWVVIGMAVLLLLLGGAMAYFRWREKKEDKKERETARHTFDFNAL